MYQRILVAVDGSPACAPALHHAIALAKEQGAQLQLVHVIDEAAAYAADSPLDFQRVDVTWRTEGQRILHEAAALARESGVTAETTLLQEGAPSPADLIVGAARACGADLLVIGTHGRRGLRRFLLGSVAEGVVRQASMPVLLVRAETASHASPSITGVQGNGDDG